MIEPMQKIQIAGLRADKEALLRLLQEEEVLHATEVNVEAPSTEEASPTAYRLAKIQFVLNLIDRIRREQSLPVVKSWRNIFSGKPVATIVELENALERLHLDQLLQEAQRLSDEMNDLQTREEDLKKSVAALAPWQPLHLSRQEQAIIGEVPIHHALVVTTDRVQPLLEEKLHELATADWHIVARRIEKKVTHVYLEVITHRREAAALTQHLKEAGATEVTIALGAAETITDKLRVTEQELAHVRHRYQALLKEASATIMQRENDIKFAYDALLHRQEREMMSNHMTHLTFTTLLTGWIPANRVSALEQKLQAQNQAVHLETIAPAAHEKPPVAFRNNRFFNAFEAVTDIYGKPGYHELDPSPALAIFFLAAFGLALTDAGYGIVLILSMWAALKFFRLKKNMRKMVKLLMYAGISTTILGALTGGWFSINLEQLSPGVVRDGLLFIKILDPLTSPMTLLVVALGLGIIQLLSAWGVRGYDHWRTGNRLAIFLDDIPWITMVISLLAWAGATRGVIIPTGFAEPLKWLAIANAGLLIVTQGRTNKNPFLKIASGVLSLYALVNFLSDTLSYSRLLALGLATGIIGLVVNMIAGLAHDAIPIIGPLAAVAVLLVGHVFNLGINALGAFIHSGRLQFVEFFPKFLEGGGIAYKPFGRVSRYVDNPREFE